MHSFEKPGGCSQAIIFLLIILFLIASIWWIIELPVEAILGLPVNIWTKALAIGIVVRISVAVLTIALDNPDGAAKKAPNGRAEPESWRDIIGRKRFLIEAKLPKGYHWGSNGLFGGAENRVTGMSVSTMSDVNYYVDYYWIKKDCKKVRVYDRKTSKDIIKMGWNLYF